MIEIDVPQAFGEIFGKPIYGDVNLGLFLIMILSVYVVVKVVDDL
jgi:hypothetical protein